MTRYYYDDGDEDEEIRDERWRGVLIVGGLMAAALIAWGAFAISHRGAGNGCDPAPCATADGLTAYVTSVDRTPALLPGHAGPPAGKHNVLVWVRWSSAATDAKTVDSFAFALIGPDRLQSGSELSCTGQQGWESWSSVTIANGGQFGPKPYCFEVGGDPAGSLELVWSPNAFADKVHISL